MKSTLTLSPPTSRAMEARSSVEATTLTVAAAGLAAAQRSSARAAVANNGVVLMRTSSEGMGAVGADGKEELEEQIVGVVALAEARVPVLGADLAELARPEGQDEGCALVDEERVRRALGVIVAEPAEPASRELVLAEGVHAEGVETADLLLALAPDELAAREEPAVDGAPQRPVAEGGVDTEEPRRGV